VTVDGKVLLAELTGSDSVIHFDLNGTTWISQSHGVHPFDVGAIARLYIDVDRSFLFAQDGRLVGGME
jgi:glycerol transport system ATP-binding protein